MMKKIQNILEKINIEKYGDIIVFGSAGVGIIFILLIFLNAILLCEGKEGFLPF